MVSVSMPTFHHLHINSVDPERSLGWYEHYWPEGERTTLAGFPAFHANGFYILYTKVSARAPGGFDSSLERSVPQSAFWTFGSTFQGADSLEFRERIGHLDPEEFAFVPLYGGPGGTHMALNSFGLPMGGHLLTLAQLEEQAKLEANRVPWPPQRGGQDFGYLVDPDGMLAEFAFIAGAAANFGNHSHFWHEQPLCAANWYVEHLGMQLPPVRDPDAGAARATAKMGSVRGFGQRRCQLSCLHAKRPAPRSPWSGHVRQWHLDLVCAPVSLWAVRAWSRSAALRLARSGRRSRWADLSRTGHGVGEPCCEGCPRFGGSVSI